MKYLGLALMVLIKLEVEAQKYQVVDDLRTYNLKAAEKQLFALDSFTRTMIKFQIDFLSDYNSFQLEFDTTKRYTKETTTLGKFYFHINRGDYYFYTEEEKDIDARNDYIKALELGNETNNSQLICEASKKLLSFNHLGYLIDNSTAKNYLPTYEQHAYDAYEEMFVLYYELLFMYKNDPADGDWSDDKASQLLEYVEESTHYLLNAMAYNLIANYSYNVLKDYDEAVKLNTMSIATLGKVEYGYKSMVLKQAIIGLTRRHVREGRMKKANSTLEKLDTVTKSKIERYYMGYYHYYQSAIDTSSLAGDTSATRYKKGYENFRRYKYLEDKLVKNENQNTIRLLGAQFQANRQEVKIEEQNKLLTLTIVSLAVLLTLSGGLVYSIRRIKSKNKKIEVLMKELHHRVKNNLQVISSLLGLQSMKLKDDAARKAVSEGKDRLRAMSLIHQKLYQKEEVTSLNMGEYISSLINELSESYGNSNHVEVKLDVLDIILDADRALPIGLIINELVSNAFKYAFDDVKNPTLEVKLINESKNKFELIVSDNGPGLSSGFEIEKASSFGMKLVSLLVKQLKGSLKLIRENGVTYQVKFQMN